MSLLAVAWLALTLIALGLLLRITRHGAYAVLRTTALIVTLAALAAAITH